MSDRVLKVEFNDDALAIIEEALTWLRMRYEREASVHGGEWSHEDQVFFKAAGGLSGLDWGFKPARKQDISENGVRWIQRALIYLEGRCEREGLKAQVCKDEGGVEHFQTRARQVFRINHNLDMEVGRQWA